MNISDVSSIGLQGLAAAAESDMKIAQLLQTAAAQMTSLMWALLMSSLSGRL